jgi:S-formylglutathione hydrolase
MSTVKKLSSTRCFGGEQAFYQHLSESTGTEMTFSIFVPETKQEQKFPVLYWLSGLTCTAENFTTKAGFQRYAAEHNLVVVAPDTSPRGDDIPDVDEYDLGKGAGFYLNATQEPWSPSFRMYDYVVHELPALVEEHFPVTSKRSISGHSMGGHGALICALKNPGHYQSVSAFAPIVAPTTCPWGEKAFLAYLGEDRAEWEQYDAHLLLAEAEEKLPLFVDQGDADSFLETQLKPHLLQEACAAHEHPLRLRMQPGYDHSYYFIATFIQEHIAFHAEALASV